MEPDDGRVHGDPVVGHDHRGVERAEPFIPEDDVLLGEDRVLVALAHRRVRDVLAPERLRRGGLFDPKAVGRLVDQHIAGIRDHDSALSTLLVFELWRLEYLGADAAL